MSIVGGVPTGETLPCPGPQSQIHRCRPDLTDADQMSCYICAFAPKGMDGALPVNSRWIFRFFGLIYMIAPIVAEAETEPVSVVLSQSADQIATRKTSIIVSIRNDGDQAVTISKFQLPFDWHGPLPNRQFDVTDFQGQKQEYTGSWDKVVGRPASSFVHLGAHQTLTGTVELRYSYRFDTQVSNHFTVQYSLPLGIVEEGTEPDENSPSYSVDPNRIRVITSNVLPLNIDATSPLDPAVASAEPTSPQI